MTENGYEVDRDACRRRQHRLLDRMVELQLDTVLITRHESVQWLTGAFIQPPFCPAAAFYSDGKSQLVLPSRKTALVVAADEIVTYEEKWHSTLRDNQRAASNAALLSALPTGLQRVGGEWSELSPDVCHAVGPIADIEPEIFRLRRRKDPDELRMLQRANDANEHMYAVAREIIQPGINELEVYSQLHSAAVQALGEPLTYFGQDFRSDARGGPPRNRCIAAGELYILDLGVGFRGYYSDNARTIAVGGDPSPKQTLAWSRVCEVLQFVESQVRPGLNCRKLFEEAQATLDRSAPWVFNHHLGHGVGLAPHEAPHLNPNWDDVFEVGDFFTAEPGLYHDELQRGVRLEENYLVTADGIKKLTHFPLSLS